MINKPCPSCKTLGSVLFKKNKLKCTKENCDFEIFFSCPLCDKSVRESDIEEDDQGYFFSCGQCGQKIHTKRIQHLIENSMQVDTHNRCSLCNSPTVHRKEMNIGNRCFFFPKCSGQSQLFASTQESLVFLDFETTGLDAGIENIIEIGALKIDQEGYEHIFSTFVNPQKTLENKITSITGITQEMLISAPTIDTVLPLFLNFIGSAILVAHNAEFDLTWLLVNCKKLNIVAPNLETVCTVKWAKQSGELQASLGHLTKKYKITHHHMHRALADAAATKELFFIFDNNKKNIRPLIPLHQYENLAESLLRKKQII